MSVAPPDDTRSPLAFRVGLSAIAAAALAWRVGFTLATKAHDSNLFDEGDAFYYGPTAANLARGQWFINPFFGTPAADHPPLTLLVLAPASRLFTNSVLAQRLTMTVLGTGVVVVIGLLGRQLAGPRAGLVAAAIAAVNANLWMNDALVMSESISALFVGALLIVGYRLAERRTIGWAVAAGALCGVTVLARAEIAFFVPFMIWPLVLAAPGPWRQRAVRAILATLAFAVVITPWSIWNSSRFHDTVLVSTNDGLTLVGANCPDVYQGGTIGFWSLRCGLDASSRQLDPSQNSTRQRHLAVTFVRKHLDRLPSVLFAREGRTWGYWNPTQGVSLNEGEGRPRWASWTGFVTFWVLAPVSIAGAVVLRRRGLSLVPVGAAVATVIVVTALFYGIARFRLPVDVVTCVLTGVFVDHLLRRRTSTNTTSAPAQEPVPA
ncbi:MAG: glycosyltransferase family 39 protein [Actinomycetota bacterium]|nr:glycosyltransferase family 39 protein [Actinomycetota bacterium]